MPEQQRIRGVLAPVVTPFGKNLATDPQRFLAHCRWLLAQGSGLAVFGTNSEANSLSLDERLALLEDAVLDPDIHAVHWMDREAIIAASARMRSPLVLDSIERQRSGLCYPLDLVYAP